MAYNNKIPVGPDRFYVSQGDILQNFQQVFTDTQVNHVVLNDAEQGKHKFVQIPNLGVLTSLSDIDEPAIINFPDFVNNVNPSFRTSCTFDIIEKGAGGFRRTDPFRFNVIMYPKIPSRMQMCSYKLPSGLLVKQFLVVDLGTTSSGGKKIVKLNDIGIPFVQTYFALVADVAIPFQFIDSDQTSFVSSLSFDECRVQIFYRTTPGRPYAADYSFNLIVFGRGQQ